MQDGSERNAAPPPETGVTTALAGETAVEDLFQILVNAIPDHALYMLDPEGKVVTWNAGAERNKGYIEAEILGKNYACFFPPEAVAEGAPQRQLRAARETGRFTGQGWRIKKDGSRFWADVSLYSIVDGAGALIGYAKLTRDMTADREREQLRRDCEKAEAADRAKSLFLANMSHELRTPLNAIIGFTQLCLLKSGMNLQPDIREYLGYVEESGERLLRLIENVLDLAKIEEGFISLSMESLNPRSIVRNLERHARTFAVRKSQIVSFDVPPEATNFMGDQVRVEQVLLNFISNAAKYGREGGVIEIGYLVLPDHRIEFFVADEGPGIPWERQAQVFQPFQRLGFENSAIEGTGVGLSIASKLAEAMRGEIGFSSVPGKGSRFYVRFEPAAKPTTHAAPQIDPQLLADLPPIRILCIEDNPTNLLLFSRAISTMSKATLVAVPTAEEGLRSAFATPPDLIVTDIHLPDFDGFEVLERLRRNRRTRKIPVLAVSADAQQVTIERGLAAGFASYITKPIQIPKLLAEMLAALSPARRLSDPTFDVAKSLEGCGELSHTPAVKIPDASE